MRWLHRRVCLLSGSSAPASGVRTGAARSWTRDADVRALRRSAAPVCGEWGVDMRGRMCAERTAGGGLRAGGAWGRAACCGLRRGWMAWADAQQAA